jgi:hypothetical protein
LAPQAVNIAVEDALSEAVVRVLLARSSTKPKIADRYPVKKGWQNGIGPSGYGYIRKSLKAFNAVAGSRPFVVLVDADNRSCPATTIAEWLGGETRHKNLLVRVAVREVEAWLLADKTGFADYLGIPARCIPAETARIKDPKTCIVRLARRSSRRGIRDDLAPASGTSARTGPYYNQGLANFVKNLWDVAAACKNSESLDRARRALDAL